MKTLEMRITNQEGKIATYSLDYPIEPVDPELQLMQPWKKSSHKMYSEPMVANSLPRKVRALLNKTSKTLKSVKQ